MENIEIFYAVVIVYLAIGSLISAGGLVLCAINGIDRKPDTWVGLLYFTIGFIIGIIDITLTWPKFFLKDSKESE